MKQRMCSGTSMKFLMPGKSQLRSGARVHSERFVQQAFPLQSSYSSLFSPRRFVAYVGHVAFDTLPR